MGLYSVMMVDDEEAVREAMVGKLDWEQIGFQVIGTAENGEEALELAEKLRPDVVMTDIKMPFMDGLTFCHKLKERQKGTRLVIFSGFDEFDYAKEAIKLEVEEYFLKPIDPRELRSVFVRIKKSLDEEVDAKRNHDKLFQYYIKSLPVMKEQFIMGLLEGRIGNERIQEMNRSYEVNLESDFYTVAVFRTDARHQELINLSLKQIIDENMEGECDIHSFVYLDAVVVILMINRATYFTKAIRELDQICKSAQWLLEANVTAGIGQMVNSLEHLKVSYRGALDAVDYRVLLESNQAIYIQDIQPSINHDFTLSEQDIQGVMKAVKLGKRQELKVAVDALIYNLKNSKISLPRFQVAMMEMVMGLAKFGRSYNLNLEEVFDGKISFFQNVGKFESLDVLGEQLYQTCLKFHSIIHQERMDSTKMLTEKAKHYIEDHYAQSELSVDMICGYLGVSAAYFSTIFKREIGENFVTYLTDIRMEAALELLNNTQDKTYVIAAKVGYTEPNYFSYVFKKKYGFSPSKYRMSIIDQNDK